jgi:hypothetical protein
MSNILDNESSTEGHWGEEALPIGCQRKGTLADLMFFISI